MAGHASLFVEDAIELLRKRYGKPVGFGRSRLLRFGSVLACSINYSKQLRGDKYFFGLAKEVVDPGYVYPETQLGDFALLGFMTPPRTLWSFRGRLLLEYDTERCDKKISTFC